MKLTAIILLSACLTASAKGFSQKVTLSAKDAPLESVIQQIKKQTGYSFFYNVDWLEKAKTITVDIKNVDIEKALDIVFKNQPLSYKLINSTIVLELKDVAPVKDDTPLPPPPIDIKGRVTNENGESVIVTVLVKGTNNGTTTNNDGYFELKGVDENATLVISGVSIETQEVKVNGKTDLEISVKTKISPLDNIQIIAYGTTTKRKNIGNVSTVKAETIEKQPISNPLSALQGRVAGLQITQNTGVAGGKFTVRLRGRNSIASGNDPLFIIDGVPYTSTPLGSSSISYVINQGNPLSNINPGDIESIDVLKDADATAIYGSRGANGVILITTKQGKAGKTKCDINIYSGIGKVSRKMDLLNTRQYLDMRYEAFQNDGAVPDINNGDYDLLVWDTTRYTDWQKVLIGGTANVINAQLSLSGGTSSTQFLIGGGYRKETTVFPGDFADIKGSVHFNLTHTSSTKKLKVNLSSSLSFDNNDLPGNDLVSYALSLPPNAPSLYNVNGNLNWENGTFQNPLFYTLVNYRANSDNIITNAVISYNLLPGLQLRTNIGYTNLEMKEKRIFPKAAYNPATAPASGFSYFGNNQIKTWIIEPQFEYNKNIGKGKLSVLLGTTFQNSVSERASFFARGFSSDALLENMQAASTLRVTNQEYAKYKYNAVFGRVNYELQRKYLFSLTGRKDGSSRFGPGKQFANFGAVGLGWIFTEENFIKNNAKLLSFGKVRASYGTTGNDQIADYGFLDTWMPVPFPYQGVAGLYPTRIFNPEYSWESTKKIEVGLELGFLNDRILFTTSYYRNRSSNQLVGYPLPLITGFPSIQNNFPATVQNTGAEFELNTQNISSKNFSWTTSFNLSIPRNKLISFPDLESSGYFYSYVVGKSLFIRKAFQSLGVHPTTGLYHFTDVNNDGQISWPEELLDLKSVAQSFYGGFQNIIQYKGFELDFLFQFVKQTGDNYYAGVFQQPGFFGNQPKIVMNRWQKPGDNTDIQKYTQSYAATYDAFINNKYYSDFSITDASFIRLKNLEFSYKLPQDLLRKIHASECKVYVQAQNLVTITKYLGMDPDQGGATGIPSLRMITAGIQMKF